MCDGVFPTIYDASEPRAKSQTICYECDCKIKKGEKYEYVTGKWDQEFRTYKTCSDCLALRRAFQKHINDFCLLHGGLLEDMDDYMKEITNNEIKFGIYRLIFKIYEKSKKESKRLDRFVK